MNFASTVPPWPAAALSSRVAPSAWRLAALVVLAFAVLYNVSPAVLESASSGRAAALLLLLWAMLEGRLSRLKLDWLIFILFLPLPLALVQFALVGDPGQLSRFFHLALYSYLCAMLFARLARDMPTLLAALVIAVSIQALLIFVSFVDLEARRWIVEHIAISTNVLTEDLYRAPGVTGSGGSALSVVQCLGVLSGGLLLRLRGRRQSLPTAVAVLLAMLLCLLSAALVGRTGFLLAILFLLWFAASSGQLSRLILIALALGVPAALSIPQLVEDLLPSSFSTDVFTTYVLGFLLTGTDASVSDLASMPIPPLGFDTLLGTGRVSPGPDGGNPSGHDSGFVQAYFGMGLVYATAFYACYAYVLLRLLRWLPLATRLMLAAALFAIEIKEPYVFKYACLFVLVACYTAAPLPRKAK